MSSPAVPSDFALRCINTVRCLAADMVQKANSGHPGVLRRSVAVKTLVELHWPIVLFARLLPRCTHGMRADRVLVMVTDYEVQSRESTLGKTAACR